MISKVFHTETGLEKSFKRDLKFKDYCNKNRIEWIEEINNGVFRGLNNRKNWILNWNNYMKKKIELINPKVDDFITLNKNTFKKKKIKINSESKFQKGGTTNALKYLDSFLDSRINKYQNI